MGFLDRLFGKKKEYSQQELKDMADELLGETEKLAAHDLKGAMKKLLKRPPELDPLFDFTGSHYERFADLTLELIYQKHLKNGESVDRFTHQDLPALLLISDEECENAGQVIDAANRGKEDLLYMRVMEKWDAEDTLLAIEAMREFKVHPGLIIIFLNENYFLMDRREFCAIGDELDKDTPVRKLPDAVADKVGRQEDVVEADNFITTFGFEVFKYYRERD